MKRQIVRYVLPVLIIFIAGVITAIQVEQLALRGRAKRLHRDIVSLRVNKSTYEDVQALLKRWHQSPMARSCQVAECAARFELADFFVRHLQFFSKYEFLTQPYRFLGGRPAVAEARVQVRNGVLTFAKYQLTVDTSGPIRGGSSSLIGDLSMQEGLPSERGNKDKQYVIGWPGGCTFCIKIYVRFGSSSKPDDQQRLSQMNFSCLTKWLHPCIEKADIMPAAWAEARR